MEMYGPLVTPGLYMIVEDSNINGHPVMPESGPGPMEALDDFHKAHPGEWITDVTAERLLLTHHPRGFLVKAGGAPIPPVERYW
jgi:cephalosporin hydroxylase